MALQVPTQLALKKILFATDFGPVSKRRAIATAKGSAASDTGQKSVANNIFFSAS